MSGSAVVSLLPLLAVIPVAFKPDWMPLGWAVAAALPCAGALYLWRRHFLSRRDTAPFLPVIASFYAISFGLTGLLAGFQNRDSEGRIYLSRYLFDSPEALLDGRALALAAAGSVLLAGFAILGERVLGGRLPAFRLPAMAPGRLQLLAWLLIAAHLAYYLVPAVGRLPSVGQLLQPAGYIGFGVLFAQWLDGRLPRWQAAALFLAAIPAIMALRLFVSSAVTPLVYFFLLAFLLVARRTGRLPWRSLAVGFLVVLLLYPGIGRYRALTWGEAARESVSYDRGVATFARALSEGYEAGALGKVPEHLLTTFVTRAGLLPMLSQVVRLVPERYPFLAGETYRPLATAVIPRVLYPGKPEERFGTEFAHRYGFTLPIDNTTLNVPWLTEQYLNFGVWGVLCGMSLVGVFMAVLDRVFNRPEMRVEEAAIGLGMIFPLVFQESNFSLMVGSLPLLALAIWLYFRLGGLGARRDAG